MDLNYRESDEEVVKIEPNSSLTDGQEMTFGLGLDQAPFGSQPAQSLPQQHLLPQQITPTMSTTPQSAKKVSGRVERAARIAELFDAGSPRVRLDHFVYKVDDNPVFDAARVFLDGECQNLVYCCDPKCAEKPTFKRFFSPFKPGAGTYKHRYYLKNYLLGAHHNSKHLRAKWLIIVLGFYRILIKIQTKNFMIFFQ